MPDDGRRHVMLLLFSLTIFLGAVLLFSIQLIFARMALPLLGGAPAVWNTAMVFYQAVLLAGYGYAHWLTTRFSPRRQWWIHSGVLLVPLAFLPVAIPAGWEMPGEGNPVPWLLGLLAVAVGVPFFAVSATSPLLQRWFARTDHPAAADPYFLYAASNAGSLIGLLAYPLVIEPHSTLDQQSLSWAGGFALLAVASLACGRKARYAGVVEGQPPGRIGRGRKARWVLNGFVPSSLMLSVTTYISSEIAAVPLLWVLPLSLYLVSFMVVFARRPPIRHEVARRLLPPLLVAVTLVLATGATTPLPLLAALHLLACLLVALVCHGEIARDRPPASSLTEFYLWMSAGGVLGGVFNALIAPVAFDSIAEYPLMLVAAAGLAMPWVTLKWPDLAWAALPGAFAALAAPAWGMPVAFCIAAIGCFLLSRHGGRFALGLAGVLVASTLPSGQERRVIHEERSFFGLHRVEDDGRIRQLFHGKTIHGLQDPSRPRVPLSYYHPAGPLGRIFATDPGGPIGAVGLGAGALAAYGKPGQVIDFYEIDPVVAKIAADPRWFSYLSDSPATIRTILGDARVKLAQAPDEAYQLLVLDAYGSDSVPVHLLTREALQLYLRKLAPGGRIAIHISNLHLDLEPVIASLAADAGLACAGEDDDAVTDEDLADGRYPSRWMVLARQRAQLEPLLETGTWREIEARPGFDVWRDDHAAILPLLRAGGE